MRQQQCPNCTTPQKSHEHLTKVHCVTCGIEWTYLSEDIQAEVLYEDEVYAVVDNRKSVFERIIFSEASKVIHTAQQLLGLSENVSVLDFGCGKGQFLARAKEQGWKTVGVETAQARATFAKEKYGIEVINEYYKGGKVSKGSFQVITLLHVLEHLPQPMQLLSELVDSNLEEGGVVVIEVPNAASWQAQLAGDDWMHWDIPKHLSHWNENSLTLALKKIGLTTAKTQYYSLHLGVLGMLRALMGKVGYRGNIIVDLKGKKKIGTLVMVAALLPLAWIWEILAVGFKKGGVLRMYLKKEHG
ncbi:MAG: class I SAM-dependent methyltransferase [Mongoliitalea sp.]